MYVGGMKMIQILNYQGNDKRYAGKNVEINSIHDAKSLDDFEINIIDLNDEEMWTYAESRPTTIDCIADISSLAAMIANSKRTTIVVLFPQNLIYRYNHFTPTYEQWRYLSSCELKDSISPMFRNVVEILLSKAFTMEILYENTETKIGNINIKAAFYFNDEKETALIKSTSGKKVACRHENIIVTTLYLEDYNHIIAFLKKVRLLSEKQEIPKWMEEIQMFDDVQQLDLIRENREKIHRAEQEIGKAKKIMDQNSRYKSILYTTGDELVEVVLEILGQLLNYDFSKFEDKKNEDFLAEIGDDVFIGEIKGVNHNVKSENISQLDVHYQGYLDNNEKQSENVHALLIMNHQKNKPVADREPVHERQVALAVRNGSLIIDTYMLLKLFEKFKRNEISTEGCKDILKNNIGILKSI